MQNSTNHFATLPTGHIRHIEVSITNEKPKYYQVHVINTSIHNVTHTYQTDIRELIPQTNYSLQDNHEFIPSHHLSLHQVDMTNSDKPPVTSPLYIVQRTSHTSKPRVFPSFPYTTENL